MTSPLSKVASALPFSMPNSQTNASAIDSSISSARNFTSMVWFPCLIHASIRPYLPHRLKLKEPFSLQRYVLVIG